MLMLNGTLVNWFEQTGDRGVSKKLQILSNGGPKVKLIDVKDSIPVPQGCAPIKWDEFVGKEIQLEVTAGVFQSDRGSSATLYWGATRLIGVGKLNLGSCAATPNGAESVEVGEVKSSNKSVVDQFVKGGK